MKNWEEKMAWGKKIAESWGAVTMEIHIIDAMFWVAAERDGINLDETDVYDMTEQVMNGEW
jgi:hypothetical protein